MAIIRCDSRFRLFLLTGLVALAYYAGAKVGLAYAIVGGAVSLVWPSSGIALVALLALGFEVAPGIAIGSLLANVSVGVPLPVAAVISVGAIVAALTAAILLNRVARFQITLDRIKDVLALIALAAVLSTAVSALIGATAVFGGGLMPIAEYGAAFLKWWLGDMMGVLVVAPPLLSLLAYPNPIRSAEQAVMLSVVGDTKHAFYNALRRREEIGHAQENLQLVEDLRRRVEVSVNVGEEGRLELTRAEAELGRARFAVTSAQLEFANAIALLRVTIAGAGDAELDPQGAFEARISLPPLKQLRDHVLQTHPILAASQADIQAALATLDRQRALRIPQPVAFAEYENQPDLSFWRTGVNVPIPLWDRRQGQIGEAKAATSQSAAVLYQRTLELVSALERAYEQYQLADQQVTSLESGSLRAAVSAVDAAKAAYRFGERGIVEVLDAQRVLQSVRGDLVDAQFARQSALVDLEELGAIAPGAKP